MGWDQNGRVTGAMMLDCIAACSTSRALITSHEVHHGHLESAGAMHLHLLSCDARPTSGLSLTPRCQTPCQTFPKPPG
eukprot:768802-Hanusia_phi.AAC.17